MHASTLTTPGCSRNWLLPAASCDARPAGSRTGNTLAGDLFYALAPGLLGVAVLAVLVLALRV